MAVVVAMATLADGFFFFFQWWWPATASRGCGFAKKVVGFQRKGETDKKREKEERKKHT